MYKTSSAEDALIKAKEIAARLTGAAVGGTSVMTSESISTAASGVEAVATATATATVNTTTATISTPLRTERKRKRWGSVASSTPSISQNNVTDALPGLAEAKFKQKQQESATETSGPSSKRIWVPTSRQKPETHFSSFLVERLPELLALINDKECVGGEQNKVELSGRGASTIQVLGMPLEPMHVMIHGSEPFIVKVAPRLEELLAEGERADREGPPPEHLPDGNEVDEKEDKYSYSSALTLIRPYYQGNNTTGRSSQSSYKPATVAQLISNNPDVLGDMCSGTDGPELLEEMIKIPNGVVGFVIGRGGETISSMQARSGCKVQIQKEHELGPGQTERIITLQAVKQESIDECRGIIENMVKDRVNAAGGGSSIARPSFSSGGSNGGNYYGNGVVDGGGTNSSIRTDSTEIKVQEALAEGHKLVKVEVPDADVGLVIGKGGATIKFIQGSTGSCIQIPHAANADDASIRTISITCPTQEGAEAAKTQVVNIIQNKTKTQNNSGKNNNNNHDNNNTNNGPPPAIVQVAVPNKDVGLCIGRNGCVIRQLQGKTNTRINIPPQPVGNIRLITVTGPSQEACNIAKAYIERIVNEQSAASIMTGIYQNNQSHHHNHHGGGGGGGHHYRNQHQHRNTNTSGLYVNQVNQNNAQSNDPAWQAYHAAQALANKQQQELQQQHAAASAAPASDAYYEQFHRYAYYYGEKAARQYYESWSPPVGTVNPYGTNPIGITDPPPSESGPSITATQAQSQPQAAVPAKNTEVRDSSVRKVSNLPAWMTKS